ncbi:Serine/threonine-protein phosphatase 2A regulatory subunit B beta isoform [Liparis tanakae]|uniref:Serine/threonine-protein phosphatase 2A regulatory subunit B beta isoform n=1 Tax=Liparis tanakae TaxID=230148 RepID=A0A4Z2EZG8_9TELE|nr:Serine/threonine-protein phosphatase 2A regulatory subunit B beta isoform [Liparis tanakae]
MCLSLVDFEEPEDPSTRSFFSEIISSISDVKFSHSGRYLMTRDYLTVKVWDLQMESKPIETYQVRLLPSPAGRSGRREELIEPAVGGETDRGAEGRKPPTAGPGSPGSGGGAGRLRAGRD